MDADDPTRRARAHARPALPRRFFKTATVAETPDGFVLTLDGRPARTPAKRPLSTPHVKLSEAVALEWQGLGEVIDPLAMPITRIVNVAIDGVGDDMEAVAAGIRDFAGSDLVCYRALEPDGLVRRQQAAWDPVLAWLKQDFGADFAIAGGIRHVEQTAAALARFSAALGDLVAGDPFRLTALHAITTLTGSAVLALAAGHGRLSTEAAWQAAHVDEDWQIAQWGEDAEAARRREMRHCEMQAAVEVLALTAS